MKYFSKLYLLFSVVITLGSCDEYKLFEKEISKSKVQLSKLYSNYYTVAYSNGLFYGKYNLEFSNGDTLNTRIIQKRESRLFVCDTAGVIKKDFLLKTSNFYNTTFDVLPNNEFVFISNSILYYSEGQLIKEMPVVIPNRFYLNKIIVLDNDKVAYVTKNGNQQILHLFDYKANKILVEKMMVDNNYSGNLFVDKTNKKLFYVSATNLGTVEIEELDFNFNSVNKFTKIVEVKNTNFNSVSVSHKNYKNDNYFLLNNNINGTLMKLKDGKAINTVIIPYSNSNFINSESSNNLTIGVYNNSIYNLIIFTDNLQTDFNNLVKVDSFDGFGQNYNTFTYFDSASGKKLGYLIGGSQNNYSREKYRIFIRKRFFNEIKTTEKNIFMSDFTPKFNFRGI